MHAGLVGVSIVTFLFMRPTEPEGARRTVSFEAIKEGINYVRHRQVVLGSMTLDMFAVIFGGCGAATHLCRGHPRSRPARVQCALGIALEAGALLMSVALVLLPPVRRVGMTLLWTVAAFGLLTIGFGLRGRSCSLYFYAGIGMADQISVVMRQTTIQLSSRCPARTSELREHALYRGIQPTWGGGVWTGGSGNERDVCGRERRTGMSGGCRRSGGEDA